METADWIELEKKKMAFNYDPLPVVLSRGEGVWLWDMQGKRYLDMMSAYSAVSHGHTHPRIVKALSDQASRLAIPSRAFHHDKMLPFIEKLCKMTSMDMALLMNTGAEAVETAIKAARRFGYEKKGISENQAEIIVATNNFHGRTVTITGFSTEPEYQAGFGPFTPGFKVIPFGDSEALADAITPNTCAFLVEPMQGEAGIKIPPKGWLTAVHKICQDNAVLLILDEIQTGLGRTGKLLACQHENIQPDGLILGKALGGGMLPISAFLASEAVMQCFTPGSHGSTFGGNPLACAVGLEALNILEDENLAEKSAILGGKFLGALAKIESAAIQDIRGAGLWVGLELDPNKASARKACENLMAKGILAKDVHETVVRFAPPLVIAEETLMESVETIAGAIAAA